MDMNMMSQGTFLGITGTAYASALVSKQAKQAKRPNVIVIMADDMGVKTLSAFGDTAYDKPLSVLQFSCVMDT